MDIKKVIGSRINEALAFSNKKQKELAAHLGVPDNTISYFCSGKRVPNAEQIIKISKFLGVSSDFLLGLSGNKTTEPKLKSACEYIGLRDDAVEMLHYNFAEFLTPLFDDSFYNNPEDIHKDKLKKISIASDFITSGVFLCFVECVCDLDNTSINWFEQCKNDILKAGVNCLLSKESRKLSKDCEILRLEINKIINVFIQIYDKRYKNENIVLYPEDETFSELKKAILSKMEAEQNGKHNTSKE